MRRRLFHGWRVHVCRCNANTFLEISHAVAFPFPLMETVGFLSPLVHFDFRESVFPWHYCCRSIYSIVQGQGNKSYNSALCLEALRGLLPHRLLPEVLNSSIVISVSLFYLQWLAVTMVILVTVIRSPFMESGYFKCLFKEYCCRSVILQLDVLV